MPPIDFDDKKELLSRLNDMLGGGIVPHNTALGLRVVDCAPGVAVVNLPFADHLVGNPFTGVLHGGAITSQLDASAGLAVMLKLESMYRIATLDLRIDYLGPGTPGRDVLTRAECYKVTRFVAFVRAVAYHDEPADPIASAAGTFMIFRDAKSPVGAKMEESA